MAKKSNKTVSDALTKSFLVRCYDTEVIQLLDDVISNSKPKLTRNEIINECLKNWLPVMSQNISPANSLSKIFDQEMTNYENTIKKELYDIKRLLGILNISGNINEKMLAFISNVIKYVFDSQVAIAPLPEAEIEMGMHDNLPERFNQEKIKSIEAILK